MLINIVNNIEHNFKDIKKEIGYCDNENIEIFTSYMNNVINNGYTDFNEYKENKLFDDFFNIFKN
jgi:hypothetical protein